MIYVDLEKDLKNLMGGNEKVINETIQYIEYLENLKERLSKIETKLNEVNESNTDGKDQFIDKFKEFFNEV